MTGHAPLHLTAADVHRLLPPAVAVSVARRTATTVAAGGVSAAERTWHRPAGMPGQIGVMPCHLPADGTDPAIFTTKVVGVFPDAEVSVDGLVLVLDATTGTPLATVDAAAVTAVRTAAHSGLSIDLLARPDAATAAILGAGAQGWAHLLAAMAVRPITAVRVWNRTPARAESMAARGADELGLAATTAATPGAAAAGADVVCACTNSPTPLLGAADIGPGTHVTAIGAFTPDTRELAADLLAAADVIVVDDRDAAAHEAGDVLLAIAEGAITADAVTADLPELVTGRVRAARPAEAITVYKSVGTSAMDAVAVRALLARAPGYPRT
ncbi:ornithine cyclodeaminase family protein [Euzebya sp.]|uniref:ornithine cyclodeaminase family protein n=1 Tax=Euzebya sp. TaxID=1971409 RepID=UPI003517D783